MAEIDFPVAPTLGLEYQFASNTWIWTGHSWDLKSVAAADLSNVAYTHVQTVPSDTWVIEHNLGYVPGGISIKDSADTICEGDVSFTSLDVLTLTFQGGFSGVAYLS